MHVGCKLLGIILPQLFKGLDYKCEPPCLAQKINAKLKPKLNIWKYFSTCINHFEIQLQIYICILHRQHNNVRIFYKWKFQVIFDTVHQTKRKTWKSPIFTHINKTVNHSYSNFLYILNKLRYNLKPHWLIFIFHELSSDYSFL